MMAKRPADRPGSMTEVIVLLEACLSTPQEAEKSLIGPERIRQDCPEACPLAPA